MNTQDLNPPVDPESAPISSTGDRKIGSQAPFGIENLDLLGSVDRSLVPELDEESPWLGDFLARYKLVSGNGNNRSEEKDRDQPIHIADAEQPTLISRKIEDIEQPRVAQVSARETEIKQADRQPCVSKPWSWIHVAIAEAIVAFLLALLMLFRPSHKQEVHTSPATEVVGTSDMASSISGVVQSGQAEVTPIVPAREPSPIYPGVALADKLQGKVLLRTYISPAGKVTDITILDGDPILARAAVAAIWKWVYPPSRQGELRQQQVTIHFRVP